MFLRAERSPEARGSGSDAPKGSTPGQDRTELQSPILPDDTLVLPQESSDHGGLLKSAHGAPPSATSDFNNSPSKRPKPRRSNLSMYAEAFRSSAASLQSGGSPTRILGSLRSRLSRSTLAQAEQPGNPTTSEDSADRGIPPSPFTEPFPEYVEVPLSPTSALALNSATATIGTPALPERRRSHVHFRKTVCDYRTEALPSVGASPSQSQDDYKRLRADSGYPSAEQDISKRFSADSGYLSVTGLADIPTLDSADRAYDCKGELEKQSVIAIEDPGYMCDEESDAASDGFMHTLYAPPVYFPRADSNEHQKEHSSGTELSVQGPNFIRPDTTIPLPSLKRTISSSRDSSKLPRYEKLSRLKPPSRSSGQRITSEAYEADTECEDGQRSPSMGSRTSHEEKLADRARRYEQIKHGLRAEGEVELITAYLEKPSNASTSSVVDSASSQSSLNSSNMATVDKDGHLSDEDAAVDAESGTPREEVIQLLYLANAGKDAVINELLREYNPDFCDVLDRAFGSPSLSSPYNQPRRKASFIAARLPLFEDEDTSPTLKSSLAKQAEEVATWDRNLVIRERKIAPLNGTL
ncbi:MAG: hypothetical protein M1812_006167 [Candelaria pacifica]|nr:MAG: hypothetical protein M1812_006167 [Candelaria pacifica]